MNKTGIEEVFRMLESSEIPKEGMTVELEMLLGNDFKGFVEQENEGGSVSGKTKLSEVYTKLNINRAKEIDNKEKERYLSILSDLNYSITSLRANLSLMKKTLESTEDLDKGIDFIQSKLLLTLGITTKLVLYVLKKLNGDTMEDSDAFIETVGLREVYKKIKPIQERITNHIEEVVRYGRKKVIKKQDDEEELLALKPNVEVAEPKKKEDNTVKRQRVNEYREEQHMPKLKGKEARKQIKQAKKILNNKYLQQMTNDNSDKPEIRLNKGNLVGDKVFGEQEEFEGSNYRRARISKKMKKEMRRKHQQFTNDDLSNFKELNQLKGITRKGNNTNSKRINKKKFN